MQTETKTCCDVSDTTLQELLCRNESLQNLELISCGKISYFQWNTVISEVNPCESFVAGSTLMNHWPITSCCDSADFERWRVQNGGSFHSLLAVCHHLLLFNLLGQSITAPQTERCADRIWGCKYTILNKLWELNVLLATELTNLQ